ncbi:MAG: nucleoside hydrolase [Clostridia bacterium]|nr:nucleoside hydrolase [Clostridia bacterium]
MTLEQFHKNLTPPSGPVDVILDTDAFNEIDDQFALSYMLANSNKLNVLGITAAPFFNNNSFSPADGMERSFYEIMKLLTLAGREDLAKNVYMGAKNYLPSESLPAESDAADFIAAQAALHTPEKPLYVVAIGAITNVASALLKDPDIAEKCVIVWLGGHSHDWPFGCSEFNMVQDIAAARVVFASGAPLVQLPCAGIVDHFYVTKPELEYWLMGKNPLSTYLAGNTIEAAESYASGRPWSRVIWDVTAVAWLLNGEGRFMSDRLVPAPIPEYDRRYAFDPQRHFMKYVWRIDRDALMADLFAKLGSRVVKMDLSDYKLVFEDDFNGDALDTDKWEFRHKGKTGCGFDGTENVRVENGNLIIKTGYFENGEFGPGWYGADLHIKKRFRRGYFECRCICNDPLPTNFWSAFWLQARGPYTPEISRGGVGGAELDVMESCRVWQLSDEEGVRTGTPGVEANIHVTGAENVPYTFPGHTTQHPFPIRTHLPDCYTQYHTYALEWTEDVYRFYVDGNCTLETSWADGVSTQDQEVCVSICAPSAEPKDRSAWGEMTVDYVRVWQKEEDIEA